MAKGPMTSFSGERAGEFGEQGAQHAMWAATFDWAREMTEQGLDQSRRALEGFIITARNTAESFDHQASDLRERSLDLAARTMSNTFELAQGCLRAKEPQEVFQLHSEFLSRQAEVLAGHTRELGNAISQSVSEGVRQGSEQARSATEQVQAGIESARRRTTTTT
jgi:hypothetical protein